MRLLELGPSPVLAPPSARLLLTSLRTSSQTPLSIPPLSSSATNSTLMPYRLARGDPLLIASSKWFINASRAVVVVVKWDEAGREERERETNDCRAVV